MSLTVSQLLADAKRLSTRLREHDSSADSLLSAAGSVLKEVEGMKQFQEDLDQLNAVAHQRPRAQLVLGIQQENRHIRQLQQENKELRAALEEHQNALELIMSKYRQQMAVLVNTTKIDKNLVNKQKSLLLQEKTDRICEMAGVMTKSIQLDEAFAAKDEEVKTRLVTENKGLREMLEISRRNGSLCDPLFRPKVVTRECQTVLSGNDVATANEGNVNLPSSARTNGDGSEHTTAAEALSAAASAAGARTKGGAASNGANLKMVSSNAVSPINGRDTDSEEDDEITFNTIKRKVNGGSGVNGVSKKHNNNLVNGDSNGGSERLCDGSNGNSSDDDEKSDSSACSVIEAKGAAAVATDAGSKNGVVGSVSEVVEAAAQS